MYQGGRYAGSPLIAHIIMYTIAVNRSKKTFRGVTKYCACRCKLNGVDRNGDKNSKVSCNKTLGMMNPLVISISPISVLHWQS